MVIVFFPFGVRNCARRAFFLYFQATALWRWSNYLQHLDPPAKIRVLINLDETSVRLVPEEGKGHVSNRAHRLLCSGMPLGRNASLAAQRSAITHVTAACPRRKSC